MIQRIFLESFGTLFGLALVSISIVFSYFYYIRMYAVSIYRSIIVDFFWTFINQAIGIIFLSKLGFFLYQNFPNLVQKIKFNLDLPIALQVLLVIFVLDLSVFLKHIFLHVYFMEFHDLHHNARFLYPLTNTRRHIFEAIFSWGFMLIPNIFLHLNFSYFIMGRLIFFYYAMFIHLGIPLSFGQLENIFVSPKYHAIHHFEKKYSSYNFSTVFSFFDLLLGRQILSEALLSYGKENIGTRNLPFEINSPLKDLFAVLWRQFYFPFVRYGQKLKGLFV